MKLTSLIATFAIGASMPAFAGDRIGNAGDKDVIRFVTLGQKAARAFANMPAAKFPEITAARFQEGVEDIEVTMTIMPLKKDGVEVNALNHPNRKLIEVNRGRWRNGFSSIQDRLTLVVHEYLGAMGVNDTRYKISTRFASFLSAADLAELKEFTPLWSCQAMCQVPKVYLIFPVTGEGFSAGEAFNEMFRACSEAADLAKADEYSMVHIKDMDGKNIKDIANLPNSCVQTAVADKKNH